MWLISYVAVTILFLRGNAALRGATQRCGRRVARRLRGQGREGSAAGGAIPAIALTAFTRQDDRQKATQAGFNDYLAKPVEPGSLVTHIAQVMGQRGQRETAHSA